MKLGARGMALRTGDVSGLRRMGRAAPTDAEGWARRELWAAAYDVDVAGTVGAGDAAVAGLLAGLLRGESCEGALELACAAGACSAEAVDAVSGVLPLDATRARMRGAWARLPGPSPHPAWHDAHPGIRCGPDDRTGKEAP